MLNYQRVVKKSITYLFTGVTASRNFEAGWYQRTKIGEWAYFSIVFDMSSLLCLGISRGIKCQRPKSQEIRSTEQKSLASFFRRPKGAGYKGKVSTCRVVQSSTINLHICQNIELTTYNHIIIYHVMIYHMYIYIYKYMYIYISICI